MGDRRGKKRLVATYPRKQRLLLRAGLVSLAAVVAIVAWLATRDDDQGDGKGGPSRAHRGDRLPGGSRRGWSEARSAHLLGRLAAGDRARAGRAVRRRGPGHLPARGRRSGRGLDDVAHHRQLSARRSRGGAAGIRRRPGAIVRHSSDGTRGRQQPGTADQRLLRRLRTRPCRSRSTTRRRAGRCASPSRAGCARLAGGATMSMFVAWVVFPLVLALLCAGTGMLVDLLSGRRLPGALVLPTGLAGMIVIGEFTTATAATAKLTIPALLFFAVLGAGLSLPWRFRRPDPWLLAAPLGIFCVFAAPVVLSGSPTFAGYIKLDDTATWFALTDRVMEHGHSLAGLEPSTLPGDARIQPRRRLPGRHLHPLRRGAEAGQGRPRLGLPALRRLPRRDARPLALADPRRAAAPRAGLRALAVFVAAQPALLFGYSLWGGVKEVAAAALGGARRRPGAGSRARRRALARRGPARGRCGQPRRPAQRRRPGLARRRARSPWWLIALRRFGWRRTLGLALPFALMLGALAIPAVSEGLLPPSAEPLTDPNSLGNLVAPLNPVQLLGIWPAGDFRFHPEPVIAHRGPRRARHRRRRDRALARLAPPRHRPAALRDGARRLRRDRRRRLALERRQGAGDRLADRALAGDRRGRRAAALRPDQPVPFSSSSSPAGWSGPTCSPTAASASRPTGSCRSSSRSAKPSPAKARR